MEVFSGNMSLVLSVVSAAAVDDGANSWEASSCDHVGSSGGGGGAAGGGRSKSNSSSEDSSEDSAPLDIYEL